MVRAGNGRSSTFFCLGIFLAFLMIILVGGTLLVHGALTPTGTSSADYVVIIVMENRNYADVIGNPSAPYLNQLANEYGVATNYHAVSQYGSLPEYLAVVSGNSYDTSWSRCNNPPSTCSGWPSGGVSDPTIVDRIEAASLTWRGYMEDMPGNCYQQNSGNYMAIHNPFIYFSHIINNPAECARVVPSGASDSALLSDLGSTSTASNYMWLTPNNCNDMWGCSTSAGDTYLSNLIPKILNSPVFQTQKAAIFITWDEGTTSSHIPAIWAGPVAKRSYASSTTYNHYSFLKTLETLWNLPPLTSNDSGSSTMTEFLTSPIGTTLQVSFTYTPTSPQAGQSISFTASATGGVAPYSYTWAFGDGSSAAGTPVSHTYSSSGSYTTTVTASDSAGATTSNSNTITVTKVGQPDFSLTASPNSLSLNLGQSGFSTITLTSLNGFSGIVTLGATVAPSGPTLSFTSSSISLTSGSSATSSLSVHAGSIATGKYTITVTATSGQDSHSVTIVLNVSHHHHHG